MPSFIPSNFTPRQDDYIVLQREGIMRDFLEQVVTPEFIEYWTELKDQGLKKGKKSAWFTAYRKWARRAFQGKAGKDWEDRAKYQNRGGGLKTDLFEAALQNFNEWDQKTTEKSIVDAMAGKKYRLPDPPKPGPAMSPTEAFDQLRKQGLLK